MNDIYEKYKYSEGVYLDDFDCQRELNKLIIERYKGIYNDSSEQEIISCSDEHFESLERKGMIALKVEFNFEDSAKNFLYDAFLLKYGKPSCISCLIKNIDFFSLSPSCVGELEELNVNIFLGVWLRKIDKDTFELFVSLRKRKEKFSENVKKLNNDKWVNFYKENKYLFSPVNYQDERHEFHDGTNLGFGDDDEDNMMRGLGSGNGDLFGF